jgi:hypothetical protein
MPERHGGDLRKRLIWSFDNLDAAWKEVQRGNENRSDWQTWTVEDHGEAVEVEQVASFF